MGFVTAEEYERLAEAELTAAMGTSDVSEKKRFLNQASQLVNLAELARGRLNLPPDVLA